MTPKGAINNFAGSVGFEPTKPFGLTGFQAVALSQLGQLKMSSLASEHLELVNSMTQFFGGGCLF